MNKNIIIASILLISNYSARAESIKDTLMLTLEQVIDIAVNKNPTIKIAEKEISIKKVAEKESWQRLLPEATITSRLDHTIQAAEMKLNGMKFKMGEDGTNSLNAGLSISLPIFAPTVYKAMSISRTDIELALEKARSTRQNLVNQITKAYYQVLLAQDSYYVIQKSFAVAEDNYHTVCAKFKQGKVSEFDKISAEVQLRSIKPNLVSASNAVSLSNLQLKILMGISDLEIKLNDNLSNYENVVVTNELNPRKDDISNNSQIRQMDLNIDMMEKNIKLQRTNFMPTIGMSLSYQYQSIYNKNINIFNYNWSGSSTLLFNINIPIYHASNFTKIKAAQLKIQQMEWNKLNTENNINMQIQNFRNKMSASSEQMMSNRENVKQAERAVLIANKRYEIGNGTVLELNSSQVSLTQARLVYNQSIYDYLVSKADLENILGIY